MAKLIQTCPQLSPVCPQLKQSNEEDAKTIVLELLSAGALSISLLMQKIGEKNKNRFRHGILNPLLDAGIIEPTVKDKPNSSKQAYRLTENARLWIDKSKLQ